MKGLFTFPDGTGLPLANIDYVNPLDHGNEGFSVVTKSQNEIFFGRYIKSSHTYRDWRQVQDTYNRLVKELSEHYNCRVIEEKEVY